MSIFFPRRLRGNDSAPVAPSSGRVLPALLAGLLIGTLQIAMSASFGALIFSSAAEYIPRGIGMALFSTAVGIALTSLLTSHPAMISGNQSAPSAIVGSMAAAITLAVSGDARPVTIIAAAVLTTLLTGLFLLALGTLRLAGLVRFLPYPVAGGFLAGTGWLLVVGGINIMSPVRFSLTNLPALFAPAALTHWLPGLLVGAAILLLSVRIRHYLLLPAIIAAITAAVYLAAALLGLSTAELGAAGWLLGPFPEGGLWPPVSRADLGLIEWRAVWPHLPSMLSAAVITAIALLLNITGLELALNRDIDLNYEMRAAGVANLGAGLGGGLIGFIQISMTSLAQRLGAAHRLTGLTAAAICGLVLWRGGAALGLIPTVVFGGLLAYLGLMFLWEWVIRARTRLPRVDYAIVLLIVAIIAVAGFLPGIAAGIVATVIMFIVGHSNVRVVKHELDAASYKSRVTRGPADKALLQELGHQVYILKLHGFLYFGTANGLLKQVRDRVAAVDTTHLIFDFQEVIGLDANALVSFFKMRRLARDRGIVLVFAGLSADLRQRFERGGLVEEPGVWRFAANLDRAAEWAEDQLTAGNRAVISRKLVDHLQQILPRAAVARLAGYAERLELAPGEHLIRQGVEPDHIFFIESGQLTAQLENNGVEPLRLETMQGGHVVGEIGFYLGTLRSAAVVADQPSVVYCFSKEMLAQIERDDPQAAQAFHRIIAHLLGERTLHLMRAIDVLRL